MQTINEITEIFYLCYDFTKEFDKSHKKHLLQQDNGKKTRNKPGKLSHSEVIRHRSFTNFITNRIACL